MKRNKLSPRESRRRLLSRVPAALSMFFLSGVPVALGGPLDDVRLDFSFDNSFGGYDQTQHTYKQTFIEGSIVNPTHRSVTASICQSLPMFVPQAVHKTNPDKPCGAQREVRAAPPGTDSIVWQLKGPDPVTKKTVVLQTRTEKFVPIPEPSNPSCISLELESARIFSNANTCAVDFSLPTAKNSPAPLNYTIDLTFRDKNKKTLATHSKSFIMPLKVPLVVSVGDSYASGEGNPDARGLSKPSDGPLDAQKDCKDDTTVMIATDTKPDMITKPRWFDARDHRSLQSGHARAVRRLLTDWPYINFLTFAKSGAKISSPDQKNDLLEQLEHIAKLLGKQKIDALIMSIGGNDAGFATGLNALTKDFAGGADRDKVLSDFLVAIPKLRDELYPLINEKIRTLGLNIGTVLITEYPQSFFEDKNGNPTKGCGVFDSLVDVGVSAADSEAISRMATLLNGEVRLAAEAHGWKLVDGIVEGFSGHGYCVTGQSFFRSAEDSCDMQGDFDGILHPNENGQAVYARAIARVLREVLPKPDGPIFN